jgi:hypothetical protein
METNVIEIEKLRSDLQTHDTELTSLTAEKADILNLIHEKKVNIEKFKSILDSVVVCEEAMALNGWNEFQKRKQNCEGINKARRGTAFNQCYFCKTSIKKSSCIQCNACFAWLCLNCACLTEEVFSVEYANSKKHYNCLFSDCQVTCDVCVFLLPVPSSTCPLIDLFVVAH